MMRVRRRETIESSIRTQGIISLIVGAVLGFSLIYFNNVWIMSGLLIAAMVGLNYSFIKTVKFLEKKLDEWEKIKYGMDKIDIPDTDGSD